MILLVDNYDSFAHNLARYLERLGQAVTVVRNDEIDTEQIARLQPAALVLSPGPCTPYEAGVSLDLVKTFAGQTPMLGVCLGHQTIAVALGGSLRRSEPMHGRCSELTHEGKGIFAGLPRQFEVGRYHSLSVDESALPEQLEVTARSEDGTIMALQHSQQAIFGVQFHPESILTQYGYEMLATFLRAAGLDSADCPDWSSELVERTVASELTPSVPITF